jgi:hypothetical protein
MMSFILGFRVCLFGFLKEVNIVSMLFRKVFYQSGSRSMCAEWFSVVGFCAAN